MAAGDLGYTAGAVGVLLSSSMEWAGIFAVRVSVIRRMQARLRAKKVVPITGLVS
jgi:hypothetical protein